jgi:DNA-binding NtrC family response regulator
VPVECAGLTESLFESELFGHAKGAFTGATSEKTGLVEAADGGTLFLDEIGEVPLNEQVKLLRLIETRQFRRVGSIEPRSADFRLVCATNRDLDAMVAAGTFRQDLLFRLNVFEIALPPLRERHDDLPILIDSILRRLGRQGDVRFADETIACLGGYPFPGNVRELRNVVERALLMCDGDRVLPSHLPARYCGGNAQAKPAKGLRTLQQVERDYLRQALATFDGDRRGLASALGVSERALYRKLAALKDDEDRSVSPGAPGKRRTAPRSS